MASKRSFDLGDLIATSGKPKTGFGALGYALAGGGDAYQALAQQSAQQQMLEALDKEASARQLTAEALTDEDRNAARGQLGDYIQNQIDIGAMPKGTNAQAAATLLRAASTLTLGDVGHYQSELQGSNFVRQGVDAAANGNVPLGALMMAAGGQKAPQFQDIKDGVSFNPYDLPGSPVSVTPVGQADISEKGAQAFHARAGGQAELSNAATARDRLDWERSKPLSLGDSSRLVTPQGHVILDANPTAATERPVQVIGADGKIRWALPSDAPGQEAPARGQTAAPDDAEAVADAIVKGQQPPETTGLYKLSGPVRTSLAKRGYDYTRANQDWNATKTLLRNLNGAQQVRLRQAVNQVDESLPLVEQLAEEWNQGRMTDRFPILNRASLSAAKNGALGQKAQSIATRLDAEIADITSELGTVYKGGNSSTDESLRLAATQLNSDWSEQTLKDAVKLARQNIQYRKNSLNLSTAGVPDSQYNPMRNNVSPAQTDAQPGMPQEAPASAPAQPHAGLMQQLQGKSPVQIANMARDYVRRNPSALQNPSFIATLRALNVDPAVLNAQ